MITATIYSHDPRSACLYRKGLRVAGVVFLGNGAIPPDQRAQLLNGFKTLKQAREFCAQMGLAWFRTAQPNKNNPKPNPLPCRNHSAGIWGDRGNSASGTTQKHKKIP